MGTRMGTILMAHNVKEDNSEEMAESVHDFLSLRKNMGLHEQGREK